MNHLALHQHLRPAGNRLGHMSGALSDSAAGRKPAAGCATSHAATHGVSATLPCHGVAQGQTSLASKRPDGDKSGAQAIPSTQAAAAMPAPSAALLSHGSLEDARAGVSAAVGDHSREAND